MPHYNHVDSVFAVTNHLSLLPLLVNSNSVVDVSVLGVRSSNVTGRLNESD